MPRPRLPILALMTPEEIQGRYRSCRDGREKTHWQVLWILTRAQPAPSPAEVAPQVGLTAGWVRSLIRRWNERGPEALADRRKVTNRRKDKPSPGQWVELFAALQGPPPTAASGPGRRWPPTPPNASACPSSRVAAYAAERLGVPVVKQTGWVWLHKLGFTPQVPRPRNPGAASPEEQQEWKRRPGPSGGRASPGRADAAGRGVGRG